MAKNRKHSEEEEGEGNSERWLLTYSDMITLLLALFIILYSMSTVNYKKVAEIAENFGFAMGTVTPDYGEGTGGGTGTGGTGMGGTGTGTGGTGTGIGFGTGGTVPLDALDEIYEILSDYVEQNDLQNSIGMDNTDTYVRIQLKDVLMFVPDSPVMLKESEPIVQEIAGAISKVYDRVDEVTISGHTADAGDHSLASDQISWRLSSERATTVLLQMIAYGLPQDKISIQGYAYYSPVANNHTEEGRAKNRRVEITVYKYPETSSSSAPSKE